LARCRGASRAKGCAVVSIRVDPRERRLPARGLRGIWHDSRRFGRYASSLLTRGAVAPSWPVRSTSGVAAGVSPSACWTQLPSGWSHLGGAWTATEDVRRWAIRSRLFQPESAEGQRLFRAPARSKQWPEPGGSQANGHSTVAAFAVTKPVVIDLHRSWLRLNTSPPATGQAARTARPETGSYVWTDDTAVAVASAAAGSVSAQLLRGA
jgi:hypothetical protein